MPPTLSARRAIRSFAILALLLLVFDSLGGVTPLWADEEVRVVTSRVRLPCDVLCLTAWALVEVGLPCRGQWANRVANATLLRIAPVALGIVTLGGAVAATVCQALAEPDSVHHEWIFAVESAGVLLLLLLWACCAQPCCAPSEEEEATGLSRAT